MNEQVKGGTVSVLHGDVILTFGDPNVFFYTIKDPSGIHARPAGALVKLAQQYQSRITFSSGEKTASADSIINIMSLGARQGTKLKIEAHGEDAREALDALHTYFRDSL